METSLDFGVYLKNVLAKKDISASELSWMLEFSSRNSLFRILNGEASYKKKAEFFEKCKSNEGLALTQGEVDELKAALEISRIGLDDYCSNQTMASMIFSTQTGKGGETPRV